MGSTEKKKSLNMDSTFKMKSSYRLRFGNITDFLGHSHNVFENSNRHGRQESKKEGSQKKSPNSEVYRSKSNSTPIRKLGFQKKYTLTHHTTPDHQLKYELNEKPRNFNEHMSQWTEEFCKPLTKTSTNFEFDMPYCYSQEFYSKLSATCFNVQPFSNIGEPFVTWNSQVDVWYEKAQLALQYYRQLSVQPSRLPSQMILIKRSMAQFISEHCAFLYFDTVHCGSGMGNVVFQKNKSTVYQYLLPDQEHPLALSDDSPIQSKSDSCIYTSSWQN